MKQTKPVAPVNPETFRNSNQNLSDPKIKQQMLNQTLITQMRHSHLASNSPGTTSSGAGINCPVYLSDGAYKCEICSKLRVVCPYKKSNVSYQATHAQSTDVKKSFVYEQQKPFVINKFQTPQFHHQSHPLNGQINQQDVKFVDSLPYIPRPMTSDRKSPRKGIALSHQSSSIPFYQPGSRFDISQGATNSHTVHHVLPFSSQRSRVIQQIVYVPHIHNVLVPQFVYNPEVNIDSTPRSSQAKMDNKHRINESGGQSSQPRVSPIKINDYNERGVMTPENLRKLAQSIIR